jgi:hypothetical protein
LENMLENLMLENAKVATRLPAQDLEQALAVYAEKLGLEPVDERPGGLLYRCGDTEFSPPSLRGRPRARTPRWSGG